MFQLNSDISWHELREISFPRELLEFKVSCTQFFFLPQSMATFHERELGGWASEDDSERVFSVILR